MNVKLLTEHHLEFLSLKGGCTGSSESFNAKMPHCWKSHVAAQIYMYIFEPVFHISFKLFPCWWRQNTVNVCVQTFYKGKTPRQQIKSSHDFIWAMLRKTCLRVFRQSAFQTSLLTRKLNFTCSKFTYDTFAGPHSAVGNVSGYRCVSDCRSRGRKFDPGPVPYFHGD